VWQLFDFPSSALHLYKIASDVAKTLIFGGTCGELVLFLSLKEKYENPINLFKTAKFEGFFNILKNAVGRAKGECGREGIRVGLANT